MIPLSVPSLLTQWMTEFFQINNKLINQMNYLLVTVNRITFFTLSSCRHQSILDPQFFRLLGHMFWPPSFCNYHCRTWTARVDNRYCTTIAYYSVVFACQISYLSFFGTKISAHQWASFVDRVSYAFTWKTLLRTLISRILWLHFVRNFSKSLVVSDPLLRIRLWLFIDLSKMNVALSGLVDCPIPFSCLLNIAAPDALNAIVSQQTEKELGLHRPILAVSCSVRVLVGSVFCPLIDTSSKNSLRFVRIVYPLDLVWFGIKMRPADFWVEHFSWWHSVGSRFCSVFCISPSQLDCERC